MLPSVGASGQELVGPDTTLRSTLGADEVAAGETDGAGAAAAGSERRWAGVTTNGGGVTVASTVADSGRTLAGIVRAGIEGIDIEGTETGDPLGTPCVVVGGAAGDDPPGVTAMLDGPEVAVPRRAGGPGAGRR